MNNVYLFLFQTELDRDELTKFLDSRKDIKFWFYTMPFSLFIRTRLSARELSELIEARFGKVIHFVTKMGTESWGRLPEDHWAYFNDD